MFKDKVHAATLRTDHGPWQQSENLQRAQNRFGGGRAGSPAPRGGEGGLPAHACPSPGVSTPWARLPAVCRPTRAPEHANTAHRVPAGHGQPGRPGASTRERWAEDPDENMSRSGVCEDRTRKRATNGSLRFPRDTQVR